jgi:phosphatidylserine/phosphatidylglycerophosphate/cardiolipin synthase-like enzyme
MNEDTIVVPVAFKYTDQAFCTAPWYVWKTEYPPNKAAYHPLVNGEETFTALHQAIANATHSINIICWGFQPSMYFLRKGQAPSIGELLKLKAREGVRVRVLSWKFPGNLTGFSGEANLPGYGGLKDRELQSATDEQHTEDKKWFADYAVDGGKASQRAANRVPLFVTRGFSKAERDAIAERVKHHAVDSEISRTTRYAQWLTPSHHQKSVLVDFEVPERAVGFVMGHNMLDEYWDTNKHSALIRGQYNRPKPNCGPRGQTPRQDISCQVSGPVLRDLHDNFAKAWRKETGEDLLAGQDPLQDGQEHRLHGPAQMIQLLRTQPQEGKDGQRDIEKVYLKAANNATQFIYIENQYFRWPPLAELIKSAAAAQTKAGRDPGLHGNLHLFVITNDTPKGMGDGARNTQRMLESLGRVDTIPNATKLDRVQQAKAAAPARPEPDPQRHDTLTEKELQRWQADMDRKIRDIENSTLVPEKRPGLKVHVCSLVAPDTPAGEDWMPVYIHSKLMIVDDVFTTHGSANINTRSMMVDSELNIAHEWASVTEALRRRLWDMHTGGMGAQDDAAAAFKAWETIINKNRDFRKEKLTPHAPLVEFHFAERSLRDRD